MSWWTNLDCMCGIMGLVGLMIKRHKRMQLFRELPGDCCNSLVASLSEQKKSPTLQGGRQPLRSVCEPLIAGRGESQVCLLQVLMSVIMLWGEERGWRGERHSYSFYPQGTCSRSETFHIGGFFISLYSCLSFFPSINHNCLCSKTELSWVSLLDSNKILTCTGSSMQSRLTSCIKFSCWGLDPDPVGKALLA